jgi:hypothetical protein
MPESRQRAVDDSHSDVEIERRFRSIASQVLSSPPSTVEKKEGRPVKGSPKSLTRATKKRTRGGPGEIRAVRGNAQ